MQRIKTYSIPFKGGIVSPGVLADILSTAAEAGVKKVRLGLRQQLLIEVKEREQPVFEKNCLLKGIQIRERRWASPGIVSAYPVIHFYQEDSWLREGVFKDVFDQFDVAPHFKINITEQHQSFVPLYTGHINWITTGKPHYWRLVLRLPETDQLLHWEEYIYTNNIGAVSKAAEAVLQLPGLSVRKDLGYLQRMLSSQLAQLSYIHIKKGLTAPATPFYLPYYEGFNKMDNAYWLGIYRRDEYFDLGFLREICSLCLETRIAELYTTPWKSLIIKDIEPASRPYWDFILGKYRVNVRHAANELNWQVEDCSEEGLSIKRAVIRHFDKEDVRTYGLCFGVQVRSRSKLFASVLIRKKTVTNPHRLKSLERYDILHTTDFNPNTQQWVVFREDVKKEYIGTYLVSLCKAFYNRPVSNERKLPPATARPVMGKQTPKTIFQCPDCLSVYDPEHGDAAFAISAGTAWEAVPQDYSCAVCGSAKDAFKPIYPEQLQFIE